MSEKKPTKIERIEALERRVDRLEEVLAGVAIQAARGASADARLQHQGNASGFPNVFGNWF